MSTVPPTLQLLYHVQYLLNILTFDDLLEKTHRSPHIQGPYLLLWPGRQGLVLSIQDHKIRQISPPPPLTGAFPLSIKPDQLLWIHSGGSLSALLRLPQVQPYNMAAPALLLRPRFHRLPILILLDH